MARQRATIGQDARSEPRPRVFTLCLPLGPVGPGDEAVTNDPGKGYTAVYRCQWAVRFEAV
jgi:hypothetical protein